MAIGKRAEVRCQAVGVKDFSRQLLQYLSKANNVHMCLCVYVYYTVVPNGFSENVFTGTLLLELCN